MCFPKQNMQEITSFFVDYVINDNLGMIANAHLVWADKSPVGARCKECIQLAALHSTAVDFCKSGVPAEFPRVSKAFEVWVRGGGAKDSSTVLRVCTFLRWFYRGKVRLPPPLSRHLKPGPPPASVTANKLLDLHP